MLISLVLAEADQRQQPDGDHGQKRAQVHAGLQRGGDPGPPGLGPGLGEQGRADRPFAADAQRGQETEDQQLPPGLGEESQAGERGVSEDRQHQGPGTAQAVAQASKKTAAQRPARQERRLDQRAVETDGPVLRAGRVQQLHDQGHGHDRIEVHVQAVEEPAQPCRDPRFPLLR